MYGLKALTPLYLLITNILYVVLIYVLFRLFN